MSPTQDRPFHLASTIDDRVPSFTRSLRYSALKLVGLSLLGVPVAVLLTLLSPIAGLLFLVLILVGVAFGIYRALDPLQAFHALAPDRAGRRAAAQQLREHLAEPETTRVELQDGVLFLTDDRMVCVNASNCVLEDRRHLLWLWEVEEPITFLRLRVGRRRRIYYYTRSGSLYERPEELVLHSGDSGVLEAISARYPELLLGPHPEWLGRGLNHLIQKVEARRRTDSP